MPNVVINVSPHRSGTQSITAWCQAHNLRAMHWLGPEFDARCKDISIRELWDICHPMLWSADVFSDLPWPLVYDFAARAHPEAKFMIVERDCDGWLRSIRRHMADRNLSHLERVFYKSIIGRLVPALADYSDDELRAGYRIHQQRCATLGDRLSVFRLEDPDLSDKLAVYFGIAKQHELGHLK